MATISEFIDTNTQLKKQAAWSDRLPDWAYAVSGGDVVNRVDLLKNRSKGNYANKQQEVSANIFGNDPSVININAKKWNNDRTTPEDLWNVSNSIARNKHLATGATYNLMKMPEEERENSALVQSFRSTANMLRQFGKTEQADSLDNSVNQLTSQVGRLGDTWMSPEQISEHVSEKMRNAMDSLRQDPGVRKTLGNRIKKWDVEYNQKIRTPEFRDAINQYANNYLTPNVYSRTNEQSMKGYLANPAIAEGLKYLTPILAGGVPLAAAASMMGNNSMWLPVLATGALGAGYGYAKNKGYMPSITNSSIGQFIDNAVNTGNNYLRSGVNRAMPQMAPITNNAFDSMQYSPWNAAYDRQRQEDRKAIENSIMARPSL